MSDRTKDEWEKSEYMVVLWVAGHETKAENTHGENRNSNKVLFCMVYVSVTLGYDSSCMVLLCVLRQATKVESTGLGVSVGGIPGWHSSSMRYGVACLLDKWGSPHEYRGAIETVKGLEENLRS